MKSLALIFSGLLLAATAVAQHSGGGHSGGGHSGGSGFHNSGGGYHGGFGGGGYGGGYGRGYAVPYAAPAYGYGFYAPPAYGYGYSDPGYAYAPPPQPEPPPAQIMDFSYGPDAGQPAPPPQVDDNGLVTYQAPAQTPQEAAISEGRYYLIAYKDHSVYTALAFWMENGALNYVTPQNVHNQLSLDLLDMDLTKTLNSRRGLAFNIIK